MPKKKVKDYIEELSIPKEEFGGMPICPYAHVHLSEDKMDLREWDPKKTSIFDEIVAFNKSKYRSTAWYVKDMKDLFKEGTAEETNKWTDNVNEQLLDIYEEYEIEEAIVVVTFNPNDNLGVGDVKPRAMSPYFIVGVVYLEELNDAHDKLEESKYFDKMIGEYKEQLV